MNINGRIPLVIGVITGQEIPSPEEAQPANVIETILKHLQYRYPHTPLRIITTPNTDSIHLIGKVVTNAGAELVLAVPQLDEIHDFNPDEYAAVVNNATTCIMLPRATGGLHESETSLSWEQLQFIQAYAFIARRCHILVVFTDNLCSDHLISQAIEFKLSGTMDWVPPAYRRINNLYPPDKGPVIRILSSGPQARAGSSYDVQYLCPDESNINKHDSLPFDIEDKHCNNKYPATMDKLDEYNADVINTGAKVAEKKTGIFTLLPDHLTGQMCAEQKTIHDVYMYADLLAGYYQGITRKITRSLNIFSSLMPLIFILYIRVWQKPPAIMLYVLLSLLVYLIYWISRKRKYQIKHLDYRALAEGLRVQFFWRILEMSDRDRTLNDLPGDQVLPSSVSDCYLRKQNNVLAWIRDAIRIVSTPEFKHNRQFGINDSLNIIREYWIADQARYYARSALRDEQKSRQFDNIVLPLILAGGITSLFLTGLFPLVAEQAMLKNIMILCVGYLPAVGGLLKTYAFTMGYEEQARQYERLANDFNNALNRFEAGIDKAQFKLLIHELGNEALRENGDWVALHRDRPVKVPGAGKSNIIEATIKLHQRNRKR